MTDEKWISGPPCWFGLLRIRDALQVVDCCDPHGGVAVDGQGRVGGFCSSTVSSPATVSIVRRLTRRRGEAVIILRTLRLFEARDQPKRCTVYASNTLERFCRHESSCLLRGLDRRFSATTPAAFDTPPPAANLSPT